jgi:hypothetical protein
MKIRASVLWPVFICSAAVSVSGQEPPPSKRSTTPAAGRSWSAPKTAWWDPDISGTWSSDDLRGVPMRRPDEVGSVLPVIYGNGNQIPQSPGYVSITYEMVHDTRIIPLDGRPHVGKSIQQYLGDARGHWEANTLIVETTNFPNDTTGVGPNGGATGTSDALRLMERFTRTAADTLTYEATVDDPKTYTRPWTVLLPLTTQPGYRVLPYECHEGNFALSDILSAARAEDRATADAQAKGLTPPAPSIWQGGLAGAAAAPGGAER